MILDENFIYKLEVNNQELHCEYFGEDQDFFGDGLDYYRFRDNDKRIYFLSEDDLTDYFVEFYMTKEEHKLKHPEYYL